MTDLKATKEKENYDDDFCDHQEGSLVSFYEPDLSIRSAHDVRSSKTNSSNNSKVQSGSPDFLSDFNELSIDHINISVEGA